MLCNLPLLLHKKAGNKQSAFTLKTTRTINNWFYWLSHFNDNTNLYRINAIPYLFMKNLKIYCIYNF